ALVVRSPVLRDQALAGQLVDLRHGFTETRQRELLVAGLDGLQNLLDRGAAARPQRLVMGAPSLVLTSALLCGSRIGPVSLPFAFRRSAGKGPVLFEAAEA